MKADESVASMTQEQIAESLAVTPNCLEVFDKQCFPRERDLFLAGAAILRGETSDLKDDIIAMLRTWAGWLEGKQLHFTPVHFEKTASGLF